VRNSYDIGISLFKEQFEDETFGLEDKKPERINFWLGGYNNRTIHLWTHDRGEIRKYWLNDIVTPWWVQYTIFIIENSI